MEAFEGTLRLANHPTESVRAVVRIDGYRLTVMAGRHLIGDWDVKRTGLQIRDDGLHLRVEGEDVIITLDDPSALRAALDSPIRTSSLPEPPPPAAPAPPEPTPPAAPPADEPSIWKLTARAVANTPRSWKLGLVGSVLVIVLGFFAPLTVAGITMLVGGVLLITGIFATDDPLLTARLPGSPEPMTLILVGVGIMLVGLVPVVLF